MAGKRITICIDVTEITPELEKILDEAYNQITYQITEYDPVFNWDMVIDNLKPEDTDENIPNRD